MAGQERNRCTTKKDIRGVAHFVTCDEKVVANVGWRGVKAFLPVKLDFFWQVHLKKDGENLQQIVTGNMLACWLQLIYRYEYYLSPSCL